MPTVSRSPCSVGGCIIGAVQELTAGTLRGHYRIVRRLGQGGMGVVYEAEDQKLGRSVAIKLLPEATRQDQVALERFWREARTASSLNHPGICTIYELNQSGDQPFIVMELLEGQSLDKIYNRRPMPYPKLLDFGVQVADALDAAHRKGVLHRDIKPSNIFLSPSGQVKILDFGLAKLERGPANANGAGGDNSNATMAEPFSHDLLTSPGAAVGTNRLHVSRAGTGRNPGRTQRCFFAGRGVIRARDGTASLYRFNHGGDLRSHSQLCPHGPGFPQSGAAGGVGGDA